MRKRRTREHIIADLGVHHTEGFILRRGWSAERFRYDYGYDLALFTYNEQGEQEPEFVFLQIKATERPDYSPGNEQLRFVLETRDLQTWLQELI
jgi:hypothetical protein